ncbi:hypothetical protein PAPYR_688 [Paratrimastix pyriformis]|uniref:Uncharacterized protein n=1 Tax=Paratrimastix pyriformis TaxID=342808 RepID=A0ABQ8UZ76_9EUKA|nr:hypothetical protein PAPYR_688 [Paratrimastix pyriformis]
MAKNGTRFCMVGGTRGVKASLVLNSTRFLQQKGAQNNQHSQIDKSRGQVPGQQPQGGDYALTGSAAQGVVNGLQSRSQSCSAQKERRTESCPALALRFHYSSSINQPAIDVTLLNYLLGAIHKNERCVLVESSSRFQIAFARALTYPLVKEARDKGQVRFTFCIISNNFF